VAKELRVTQQAYVKASEIRREGPVVMWSAVHSCAAMCTGRNAQLLLHFVCLLLKHNKIKHVIVIMRTAPSCQMSLTRIYPYSEEERRAATVPSLLVFNLLSRAQTWVPYFITVSRKRLIIVVAFHICFIISLRIQQFFVAHLSIILQETKDGRSSTDQRFKRVMFLRKYEDKKLVCGQKILTELCHFMSDKPSRTSKIS
jgi:hypothetical protein